MIRMPVFAGHFYPQQASILRQQLSAYLQAVAVAGSSAIKAMIVPHAGYQYSAPIAASAYAQLAPIAANISRVVLLGPSHRIGFNGLALSQAQAFATPLGNAELDNQAQQALSSLPFVGYLEQAHAQEHCLEVQLPFLQMLLPAFKIVPIVVGFASVAQVSQVINLLWDGAETLVLISSDLSHYHDYATAQNLDNATSRYIQDLDYQQLSAECACGYLPISGLLQTLQEKSLSIKAVDVRNSGDTAGDKRRVVGYGAYVVN